MTTKEQAEHRRLRKKILHGRKVTRAEIRRAFELLRMAEAERGSER